MSDLQDPDRTALLRLGETVRRLRAERGLTRVELAERSGLSLRFLAQLEGGTGNIAYLRLRRVAEALGTHATDLVTRAERTRSRVVSLLGLRGAGKSTVGRVLADQLGIEFLELDERVESEAGMSLGQIFELQGGRVFRRLERQTLERVLDRPEDVVIATGGGIVTDPETLALLLRRTTTVWLKTTPQEHWTRVIEQGDRRPMAGRPEAMTELRNLWADRQPLYARAAITIDTTERLPDAIATDIHDALSES